MKIGELRKKSKQELADMEKSLREKGRALRFQLAAGKAKNVREMRVNKKTIAKILTARREKQNA